MSRESGMYLDDMRTCCRKVLAYTQGMDRSSFLSDEKTFDAVIRNLEVLGEAGKHVDAKTRRRYPDVDWRAICGLRDVLAHDYFGIDEDVLWDIVSVRIPELSQLLERPKNTNG